jgi:segregation and condensation protein B
MSEAQTEIKVDMAIEEIVVSTELKNIIEALIFASDEPMTVRFIRSIMDDVNKDLLPAEQYVVNADIIRKAVGDLNRGYGKLGSGFRIIEIGGGFTHATQEQFSMWVGKLAKERARRRLSPTAVETLAIIAYKQPIAKGEVEFIRGVNVDYIINALLEKDLIHITGRASTPGRPLLYGTTQKFLEHFGLNDLSDLPKPREISELINETELEVDRRLLAEQQELEFKQDLETKLEGNEGSKNKPQKTPKIKVPDDVQTENRKNGKQNGSAAPTAVSGEDKQNIEEGELSSESKLTTDEAAAQTGAGQQNETAILENEHPEINEQDHSGTNVPENRDQHSDRSEESPGISSRSSEKVPAVPDENEPEIPAIHEQDHSGTNVPENLDQHSDHSAESPGISSRSLERALEVPMEDEPEDQMTDEQARRTIGVQENRIADSENPEVQPDENGQITSTVDAADHSEHSNENAPQDQQQQEGTAPGSEQQTGWSKWKNKVKTFFQKLFA